MKMSQWNERTGMSETDELSLWTECVFIFDSSALLNFYEYSPPTQNNIIEIIFKKLHGRLWIPFHVRDEYLKNRRTTLKKPASQYRDLLDINFKQLKNLFVEIKNKTKTDKKHPFIDQSIFSELESALETFEKSFKKNVQEKVDGINDYEKNDLILEAFQKTFKVGEDYDYQRVSEIVAEGEFRYKHKIPPGYLDKDTKGKIGFQVYGDLIIWKQIIDFSRESRKPVILVNDDKKEDWWIKSGKEILAPRDELIKEIKDVSGVDFWMYTFSEFLEKANKILKARLDTATINDVKDALINTLKEPDWEGLLKRKDFIHLNGYQYAPCSHPDLKHIVTITWNYLDYKLILISVDNPEIQKELKKTFDLENYSCLLLNPHIAPQRWLYRIWIEENKIKLELLFGPKTKVEIIDQQ
jgi:hypothetical protein